MIRSVILAAAVALVPSWRVRARAGRFRTRRGSAIETAEYFDAVARELRRGASLRHAVAGPVPGSRVERLALTGQPIEIVAAEVVWMLRLSDELATAGIRLASRTGAPASRVFGRLAEQARQAAQRERDRRTATAQARLSAGVIGLVPLALGAATLALGGIRFVAEPGPARTAVMIGVGLQLAGLVVIAALVRFDR